jgi:hypothetical protein
MRTPPRAAVAPGGRVACTAAGGTGAIVGSATFGARFGSHGGAYDAFALRLDPEGGTRWSLQGGTADYAVFQIGLRP